MPFSLRALKSFVFWVVDLGGGRKKQVDENIFFGEINDDSDINIFLNEFNYRIGGRRRKVAQKRAWLGGVLNRDMRSLGWARDIEMMYFILYLEVKIS